MAFAARAATVGRDVINPRNLWALGAITLFITAVVHQTYQLNDGRFFLSISSVQYFWINAALYGAFALGIASLVFSLGAGMGPLFKWVSNLASLALGVWALRELDQLSGGWIPDGSTSGYGDEWAIKVAMSALLFALAIIAANVASLFSEK